MEGIIQYPDFEKLDLRVAQVVNVEEIDGADKLYKLTLDVGELGERTVCVGIKEFYSDDELFNKKVILLSNLAPRKLRGIMSEGMLLAAGSKEENTCSLLAPDKDMSLGCRIS